MRRPVKIALILVAIPVALLATAAIVLPLVIDGETLRPKAEAELSRRLGRKVELGRASLSVWRGIAINADSLSIGEPLTGPAPGVPLVTAGKTAVRVALMPLLRREVQARSIRIEGGKIAQDGRALASDLTLESALKIGANGALETGGKLEGALDAFAGRPAVDASFAATLDAGTLTVSKLDAQVGAMSVGVKGRVEGVATPSPHAVVDIALALPKSKAKGPVDLTLDAQGARVRFEIEADVLDVDEVSAVAASGTLAARAGLALIPEARAQEPSSDLWLTRLSGSGRLRAQRVLVSGMDLQDGRADVEIHRGRVRLKNTSIGAYGGSAKGAAELRPFEPERPFTVDQKASGVSLEALLAGLAPKQKGTVDGTASLQVALAGRAGAASLLPTIDGKGYIEVRSGKLASVGVIPQVMRLLETAGAKGIAKDETPFERLSAHFDIVKGVARTNDLEFRSPDLDLDGGGTIGAKGALDLDVTASFAKAVSDQLVAKTQALTIRVGPDGRLTVPLEIRGTLSSPSVRLDVDRVLNEGLKETIKKEGKKRLLEKIFGK